MASIQLIFDHLKPEEIQTAVEIETEGYPADEAGSLESFSFRQKHAPTLFLGAYTGTPRKLVGYVCSTLSNAEKLTHESMSNHVPDSSSVCIHSVCVSKASRGQGVALQLLREYLERLAKAKDAGAPYERVLLIAHEELRPLYEKAGFTWLGKSDVQHGSRAWYEMRYDLPSSQLQIPADVLQALLAPSSEKHAPRLVSDGENDLNDLIEKDDATGSSVNRYDLLCPRGCRSVILKKGCAQWTERTSVSMEPEDFKHALLPPLPPPPETAQWWLVRPSPMAFENIGFTRPSGMLSTGKRLKLLTCAECDLGPLGWCEEGGSEFWLATSRIKDDDFAESLPILPYFLPLGRPIEEPALYLEMVLRVGYVREHFSTPLLQLAEQDGGKTFTLVECPSGTGQIISRLTNNEIDIAIALTDALITGIAKGSKVYKLVGSFVSSSLNWAVITGKDTKYQSIDDLKGTTLGISRYGSGSQVMAYVMALQKGWPTEQLNFQVNNDIHGLVDSVNEGSTSAFMWEWFTTKPWVDQGKARFIGSVPTPWPSWLIVANEERAGAAEVKNILERLTGFIRDFDSEEKREKANVEFIKEKFGYPEEDIKAWLKTVKYPQNCLEIPTEVITNTLSTLEKAGVLTAPEAGFKVDDFISSGVVRLT